MRMPGLATFVWRDGSDEVTAVTAGATRSAVEDAFERCVLPMVLHTRGLQVLHASAVRGPRGVLAFCATSGTGKSTVAYGLSRRAGYSLWADDAAAFDTARPGVQALPLPFSLHLRPSSLAYFGDKTASVAAVTAAEPAPLTAVFVLERAADPLVAVAHAARLPAADGFTAVLQHAYCFDLETRRRRRETAEQYLELTARVPVCRLRFRTGLKTLPAVLDRIEEIVAEA
jgi:hypothetical protein